ncbi:MAG: hypothetical protein RQ842_07090 [Vulcanisaeta sp.]|nr:hypothetical protein [Vulcanisaeta sp.]
MRRVLVFIEGWGCRKKGKREYCRVVVKDVFGNGVVIKFWRNYNKGNKILPIDDDRANAIGVLVEYLRGDYDYGIAIIKDVRLWRLFRSYIKRLHNGEDVCWPIWNDEVRETCYGVASKPNEHRRDKMRRFKLILTEKFQEPREEIIEILRGALAFMVGVELSSEELALLIKQAQS